MQPISRRHALQLGGLGLAAALVGGVGLGRELFDGTGGTSGERLTEPAVLRSSGGELTVRLEAAAGPVHLAGPATALAYNGSIPGPTLYLRPGDLLRVRLVNRLAEPTNLHTHGLYVSPSGTGDDVFVEVGPGESHDYEYRLPADHPPGVFWYHPHVHHRVADQVYGGLFGAIVVEDARPVPLARERILVVSDVTLDGSGRIAPVSRMQRMAGREGELVLVNGQANPVLSARPGERERWRVVNACTARFLRLRLDGGRMQLLGIDSGQLATPTSPDEVLLAPGNRADLLVTAATGGSVLRTSPYDRGRVAGMGGRPDGGATVDLATLRVSGAAVAGPGPVPERPVPADLRGSDPAARRRLTFAMGMAGGGMGFTIDGRAFDPGRVDQSVRLGTVEEWTIANTSPMDHPFHLHVWPMQVVEENGSAVAELTWRDVVNVPAAGSVTVRIRFDTFPGRTVYHCHILDHEDLGMMGVVEAG
jgi:FtsP/CotA-like multicopper oxidase with cupredoxin domain